MARNALDWLCYVEILSVPAMGWSVSKSAMDRLEAFVYASDLYPGFATWPEAVAELVSNPKLELDDYLCDAARAEQGAPETYDITSGD